MATTSKKQSVFPKYEKVLEQMGENVKMARKRRKLTDSRCSRIIQRIGS